MFEVQQDLGHQKHFKGDKVGCNDNDNNNT